MSASRASAVKAGWRRPLPVLVRINGLPANGCHTNLMPLGDGSFHLYLNGAVRAASCSSVGDRVRVEIEFDAGYRAGPQHPMPSWFKKALKMNPRATEKWSVLSPSRKKEVLRYFADLKSLEARARNLAKAMKVLSGQTGRFMARTWKNGR
ncbi:MAG: YdeI/OmpD-associated family protein [Terracidiphilus sp.]